MLAWSPSTDNVGVVEYGLYASGLRVATSSDASATLTNLACGTSYLVAIDAADAAGNRSAQATSYLRTSPCPSSNKPPSTPTVAQGREDHATDQRVARPGRPRPTIVGVTGYGLYLAGSRTSETTGTSGDVRRRLKCGTTYTLGRRTPTTPCARSRQRTLLATNTVTATVAPAHPHRRRRRARRAR